MQELTALTKIIPSMVVVIVLAAIVLPQAVRILREYERGVIFRLGKLLSAKGPDLILLIPVVDRKCGQRLGSQFDSCWKCGAKRETTAKLNEEGEDDDSISRFVD